MSPALSEQTHKCGSASSRQRATLVRRTRFTSTLNLTYLQVAALLDCGVCVCVCVYTSVVCVCACAYVCE